MDIKPGFENTPVQMTDRSLLAHILHDIENEVYHQRTKWGEQYHTMPAWYTVLGEEFGEVGHAINEGNARNMSTEIIQTAAVCVSMLYSYFKQVEYENRQAAKRLHQEITRIEKDVLPTVDRPYSNRNSGEMKDGNSLSL